MKLKTRTWISLAPLLAWACFYFWYTSFAGPLTETEIDEFRTTLREAGADAETLARWERFMRADDGREFIMVNLNQDRESPARIAGARDDKNSREALNRYAAFMLPNLAGHGSFPIFSGEAAPKFREAMEVMGAEAELRKWDRAALVRYRSRRDLVAVVTALIADGSYGYKVAALGKSVAMPVQPRLNAGDLRIFFALLAGILSLLILSIKPGN
ncbi:MAG: hypothetical protein NXI24_22220 [bacterium]|nr:hypothetical protein [bacterium]